MNIILFNKVSELRKSQKILEKKLKIKIKINGKKVTFEGEPFDEYEAGLVLEAISFGFPLKESMRLTDSDVMFKKISINDFKKRRKREEIVGRLIGTKGKTKRTIESLAGCEIIIKEKEVGILGPAESIDDAVTAIINLIRGTKQANVYSYLERMNREKKKNELGIGLKERKEPEPKRKRNFNEN